VSGRQSGWYELGVALFRGGFDSQCRGSRGKPLGCEGTALSEPTPHCH
jgi:hypothetical protein